MIQVLSRPVVPLPIYERGIMTLTDWRPKKGERERERERRGFWHGSHSVDESKGSLGEKRRTLVPWKRRSQLRPDLIPAMNRIREHFTLSKKNWSIHLAPLDLCFECCWLLSIHLILLNGQGEETGRRHPVLPLPNP